MKELSFKKLKGFQKMANHQKAEEKKTSYIGYGIALGPAFGVAFGLAFLDGNIGLGIGMGISFGLIIGAIADNLGHWPVNAFFAAFLGGVIGFLAGLTLAILTKTQGYMEPGAQLGAAIGFVAGMIIDVRRKQRAELPNQG